MSRLAIRYGKALFQMAREQKKIERIESELEMLYDLIESNSDFNNLLVNPLITSVKKVKIISRLFKGRLDPLTYRFVVLVCRNKRSEILPRIILDFRERVLEEKGIWQGKVFCAQPLTVVQSDLIKTRIMDLTGKAVILQEHLDRDLIGGFIVKIKDTIIDLSIKGQLDRLRTKLVYG